MPISTSEGNATFFGSERFAFGPGNFYFDTASGGENLFLGDVDSMTLSMGIAKIGLRSAQQGDRDADRAVSAQTMTVSLGMAQPTIDRLENVFQGFQVERDSGNNIISYGWANVIGERDSEIAKQGSLFLIEKGVQTTDPFKIIDVYCMAPSTETAELNYNATDQRYFPVEFFAYESANLHPSTGARLYWNSRGASGT